MPLSSAEIAGMSGQFQGMYAQQLQYSGLIGGLMGMNGPPQMQGEQVAGGLLNRVGAVAGPVSALGAGLMGLDPLSMGLKAGMGAYGAGAGVMGGAAAGLGAAGLAAAPMMAAQYVGSQILTGAQQQQQFNAQMRQSFFFNQPFGQGFSTSQLGTMGADIRGMSGQMGPGGEISTFRELSGLAANMGKMGMATGVRDVQQFRQRFQEMLNTVKTVATEMGTTLEQAQQAMASMRGSGIFRTADQVKFAMQMRQYSVAGGLATSELGAMGNIGAQISRSVGGRGAAGAFGGMRTLGQIGGALQSGAISDEDIYNATGLYGAEGRQAMATRQMEGAARFLKTGRGRYFLASVAGQNGSLDEASVNNWMGGGMGVGDTRSQAYSNLSKVGRAGFIRNEGRLRGAAMERFGGLLPAMALSQWAGEKGIDINSMGDREMLFASRQLGMGMDELETTVKEARNLPKIMASMQTEGQIDQQLKQIATKRRTQGLQGAKRKLEMARETVQNSLQQLGADVYTSGSDMVERYLNKLAGTYVDSFNADAIRASATSTSMSQFASATGIGRTSRFGNVGGVGGGGAGSASNQFFGQGTSGIGGRLLSAITTNDYDIAKQAGYGGLFEQARGMGSGAERDRAVERAIASARRSYMNMANPNSVPAFTFSQGMQDHLRELYTGSLGGKQGMDRVNGLEAALLAESSKGNAEATAALKQLQAASPEQKMAVALGIEKGGKITSAARLSGQDPLSINLSSGRWGSIGEKEEAVGAARLGQERWSDRLKLSGGVGAGLVALGPVGLVAALTAAPTEIANLVKMRRQQTAAGQEALSTEGRAFARAMAFGTKDEFDASFRSMQDRVQTLKSQTGREPHNESLNTQLKFAQSELLAATVVQSSGPDGPTDADYDKALSGPLGKDLRVTKDQLKNMVAGIGQQAQSDRQDAVRSFAKAAGAQGELRLGKLNATGLFNQQGFLGTRYRDSSGKMRDFRGPEKETILTYRSMVEAQAALQSNPTEEAAAKYQAAKINYEKVMGGKAGDFMGLLGRAKESEAAGLYDIAREQRALGGAEREVSMTLGTSGLGGALGGIVGVKYNKQNAALLKKISGKGGATEADISELLERGGYSVGEKDKGLIQELTKISGMDKEHQIKAMAELKLGKGPAGEALSAKDMEKQKEKQKQENPLLDEINSSLKDILKSSENTSKMTSQTVVNTGQIVSNTGKDPGVGGTNSQPQPGGP